MMWSGGSTVERTPCERQGPRREWCPRFSGVAIAKTATWLRSGSLPYSVLRTDDGQPNSWADSLM